MKENNTESIYGLVERMIAEAKKLNFPDSIKMVAALKKRESVETMHLLNHELKNRIGYQVSSTKDMFENGDLTTIFLTKTG
ncbi:hypothetical protein KAT63_02305 [Candidatus Parcubacteria bacterium]|nr:hypothetical protein [Candidatus Parcubacteria bacterium]